MARSPRLERGTSCLEGRCSIQLSYERKSESGSSMPEFLAAARDGTSTIASRSQRQTSASTARPLVSAGHVKEPVDLLR